MLIRLNLPLSRLSTADIIRQAQRGGIVATLSNISRHESNTNTPPFEWKFTREDLHELMRKLESYSSLRHAA